MTDFVAKTPAIVLENPKHPHNVARIVRNASSFGITQVWYTGTRMQGELDQYHGKGGRRRRLPREERMKDYGNVDLIAHDYPFEFFSGKDLVIGVELRESSLDLYNFQHPERAVYVFGPEDGSIGKAFRGHCHMFVQIPSYHCLNLSVAVAVVLYDRMFKKWIDDGEIPVLNEHRGYYA